MTLISKNTSSPSLLALAALGVCLGFILAGPSARVSAQDVTHVELKVEKTQKRVSDQKRDAARAIEQFAATLEELYRAASDLTVGDRKIAKTGTFSLNYFVSVKPNGTGRFSAHPGSRGGPEWSGRYRDPLLQLYDAFLPRTDEWNDDFLVQFELGPDDVSLKATISVDPSSNDSLVSGLDQAALKQRATSSDHIRSQIYGASQVSIQKNKVIIVANLPRAGLDSLLTKE